MDPYSISFKKSAEKDLRKIPKENIPHIFEHIESLAAEPRYRNTVIFQKLWVPMVWFGSVRRMFDESYRHTAPPWDIGRPRKQFMELARQGAISGSVLDIGCGTGENALFYAELGLDVWGIDISPIAVRKAGKKAAERGLRAQFLVQNALRLEDLHRKFDTATDSGFFHTLDIRERPAFARSLAAALRPGGAYFMLCFSELEPPGYGPRRVSQQEIRECFRDGWTINSIQPAVFETTVRDTGARGWISSISKTG